MKVNRIEAGTAIVVAMAIIAGAVAFGRLEGRLEALQGRLDAIAPQSVREVLDGAKQELVETHEELVNGLTRRKWIDVTNDQLEGCTSGAAQLLDVDHCPARNEAQYPIGVSVVTVNVNRPDSNDPGCGVALHLVQGVPDWYASRSEADDASDIVLAHSVTGDKWGVCWVSAMVPPDSGYYIRNAYKPAVRIESWVEWR